ncbi:MAG: hypothetical protein M1385_00535 [Candidatus Marsarchaeota archaeon]|nr:hypothetical protein [Candidatus Marsarchaeota archaeon]
MNLLSKTTLVVVIIIALVVSFYLTVNYNSSNTPITKSEAKALIINDFQQHSPNINVSIINISSSSIHPGSWAIIARTISGEHSACPSVVTQQFDYPATGFLNTTTTYSNYSNGRCMVYGGVENKAGIIDNIIGLPAIAIATPYNESFQPLVNYINKNNYDSIYAIANFFSMYNMTANSITSNAINKTYYNIWLVNYSSSNANYSYVILLNQSGYILDNYTLPRT